MKKNPTVAIGIICFLLIFNISSVSAQGFLWAHNKTGGVSAIDNAGNIYTIGTFTSTTDFDAGPGVYNMTPIASGDADLFILKQDAAGNFIWAKQLGAPSGPQIANFAGSFSITVDSLGYIYASGNFYFTIDFDPGPGVYQLSTTTMDYFLLKLDNNGDFVWAKNAGNAVGTSYINIGGHSQDAAGNIYAVCSFRGTIDSDPGPGIANVYTASATVGCDALVIKTDSAGNLIWARQAGGQGLNVPACIAVDSFSNVYFAGSFNDTADFDPGSGTAILNCFGGINFGGDVFVAKWNSSGDFVWVRQIGGANSEAAVSMAVDRHGSPSVAGFFGGIVDFDPGPGVHNISTSYNSTPFAFRLTSSGGFSWAEGISSPGEARGITTDSEGNIYLGGTGVDMADFDPGPAVYTLSSGDAFIQKLDSSGNFIWAHGLGNYNGEGVGWLGTDKWDNLYAYGAYQSIVDFDLGGNTYFMNGNNGSSFLLKLCPSFPILLEASATTGCQQLDTILLSTAPIAGATYTWTHNDTIVQTGNDNTLHATESGYYEVTLTGLGCPSTSNRVELQFTPATYTFMQSLYFGTTITLQTWVTNNIKAFGRYYTGPNHGSGYPSAPIPTPYYVIWFNNGVPIDTSYDIISLDFMPTAPGMDTVTAVLYAPSLPCAIPLADSVIIIAIPSAIEGIPGGATAIDVYPNPAGSIVTVAGLAKGEELQLTDLSGRVLQSWAVTSKQQSCDISRLASGYYILNIKDDEGRLISAKALIKQ